MAKVIITIGLPASGKSTWAKDQVRNGNGKIKRINKDDLREMIDDGVYSKEREEKVLMIRDSMLAMFLANNFDVIIDDTNFEQKHHDRIAGICELACQLDDQLDVTIEKKFFDVDVFECIKRDSKRSKPVGKDVIMGMYNRYLRKPTPKISYKIGLKDAIICDIDGTLAKMKDRSPFDWQKVDTDILNFPIAGILDTMGDKNMIILVSGRDESCREKTEKWLNDNNVRYDRLFMRPEGNNEDDRIIKKEIYDQYINEKYNVTFVLDDRDKVVDMWRSLGLTCLQVDYGNF